MQSDSGRASSDNPDRNPDEAESPQTLEMAEKLKRWRRKNSAALGIPAYRVLTNATIDRIAEARPTSREELESLSGVGPATMDQFGDDIVALVTSHTATAVATCAN